MTIADVKNQIHDNTLSNIYVFAGEEFGILNIYIDMIASKFDNVYRVESISDIYNSLSVRSLFEQSENVLYIIREDPKFISDEKYWVDIEQTLQEMDTTIIFKYESLSKCTKFSKRFSDSIVQFDKVSPSILQKYIQQKSDLNKENCDILIAVCNSDYSRIMLELDKIVQLADSMGIEHNDSMQLLLDEDLIYRDIPGTVFDLINSLLGSSMAEIKQNLIQCHLRGDNPMYIISLAHSMLCNILQIQLCDKKSVYQVTGLNKFQVDRLRCYVGRFSNDVLVKYIRLMRHCENALKTGILTSDNAIDYLVVAMKGT